MAGGVALGSVLSGIMLNHFWWGSIFLINVPAMLLLLVLVPVLVPEFKDPESGRFDLFGVPLSMCSVLPIVYGLKELAAEGFGTAVAISLSAGLVIGYPFAMMGSAYFTTQYLQSVLGMGTLEAALWSLAPSVAVGVAAPTATALAQRVERAYVVAAVLAATLLRRAGAPADRPTRPTRTRA